MLTCKSKIQEFRCFGTAISEVTFTALVVCIQGAVDAEAAASAEVFAGVASTVGAASFTAL